MCACVCACVCNVTLIEGISRALTSPTIYSVLLHSCIFSLVFLTCISLYCIIMNGEK